MHELHDVFKNLCNGMLYLSKSTTPFPHINKVEYDEDIKKIRELLKN